MHNKQCAEIMHFAFVSALRSITLKRKSHARRELHSMKILSARVYFQSDNSREHILFGLVFQLFFAARGKKQRLFSPTQKCDFLKRGWWRKVVHFHFPALPLHLKLSWFGMNWPRITKMLFFAQRKGEERMSKVESCIIIISQSECLQRSTTIFFLIGAHPHGSAHT
jgi:hypothetical protein